MSDGKAFADALDPAIVEAADLDPSTVLVYPADGVLVYPHGGALVDPVDAGFSSLLRVTAWRRSGSGRETFFVKVRADDSAARFAGEYASLQALADAVPGFCPRAHAYGPLRNQPGHHFLVTDFVQFIRSQGQGRVRGRDRSRDRSPTYARQLAVLHTTPMPPARSGAPPDRPWGFPVPTYCGASEQDNTWTASWAAFFADRRLRHVLQQGLRVHGSSSGSGGGSGGGATDDPALDALAAAVERTAAVVVPRLLGDGHLQQAAARGGGPIVPVLVHGDLWGGNMRYGILYSGAVTGRQQEQEERRGVFVFNPSSVYGHSEYDFGILRMLGGDIEELYKGSDYLVPKDEPVDEWEDRVALYELYHQLNHWVLFGDSYRSAAMTIMQTLLNKYG